MNEKILRVLTEAADVGEENDRRPPEFSDQVLALRFADEHKDDLRYVAIWVGGCRGTASVGNSTIPQRVRLGAQDLPPSLRRVQQAQRCAENRQREDRRRGRHSRQG